VADSVDARACPQKIADIDGLRYSPDDPHYGLGPVQRLSMFELRETGDWDLFLDPLARARAETGGADQWVLKRRELPGVARVNNVTSASLGYPLSVFIKKSTLKQTNTNCVHSWCTWRASCVHSTPKTKQNKGIPTISFQ